MIPAVIVCHGQLGAALLSAVEGIYGEVEGLAAVSNEGLSADELEREVAARLPGEGEPVILLTDYFGGSCANAGLALLGARPGARLISGVNLPILLYYLAHRHELAPEALVAGIIHRGQNSIRELTPPEL